MPDRRCILGLGVLASWRAATAGVPTRVGGLRLAATWRRGVEHELGVLTETAGGRLRVEAALPLPSRGHGVALTHEGQVLAVARRPGDWLLRWRPADGDVRWCWIEADRCFNGHVLASADGRRLYTTESDLASGAGLIGVRDAMTLEKLAEWPTHGLDPHALLWDAHDGTLLVANGGIPALPETGRMKLALDRMDSSLVRLRGGHGELLGQWRLADPRLSMRHLAWTQPALRGTEVLGIALQAEHAAADERARAPVLARFVQGRVLPCELPPDGASLAGYGGDVCAGPDHWVVGCPRADAAGAWTVDGRWRAAAALPSACAAFRAGAADAPGAWVVGRGMLRQVPGERSLALPDPRALQLDNHAVGMMMPG